MKYSFLIFLLLLVSACTSSQNTLPASEATATALNITFPTGTATTIVLPTAIQVMPTPTQIPCDPRSVDYCITDGHFILQRPIQPPANDLVDPTYRYASTANGTRDPHHGIEMGKDFGTPVQAAADGVVIFAGPDRGAVYSPWTNFYGNVIVIHHMDDLFTLYAHLSKIDVKAGEVVHVRDKIGEVGQTGAATGSHLHFEVRRGEGENYFSTVNPELWLAPSQVDYGAMALTILDEAGLLQRAKLTLEHFSNSNELREAFYVDTYDPHMPAYDENAGLGDLPAGRYRITLIQNGHLYERWVEVQSGKLTQVVIVVK
jgi:hypothetical protein